MDFSTFITILKQYGPLGALVVYVIWDSRLREQRLIRIVETLTDDIKERLTKMESFMRGRGHL